MVVAGEGGALEKGRRSRRRRDVEQRGADEETGDAEQCPGRPPRNSWATEASLRFLVRTKAGKRKKVELKRKFIVFLVISQLG